MQFLVEKHDTQRKEIDRHGHLWMRTNSLPKITHLLAGLDPLEHENSVVVHIA